jgi:hypothetical protein
MPIPEKYKNNIFYKTFHQTRLAYFRSLVYLKTLKNKIKNNRYSKLIKSKINLYRYDLNEFDTPYHGFIFLKKNTNKWKFSGYEKVGEDWHIKIIRNKDQKQFLLDQPFFYCLQIFKNKNLAEELFMTYGLHKNKLTKIKKIIKSLGLC